MSLTRSFLKSLGLDEEKIASVIEAHSETVTGLNGRYADLENKFNELNQRYSAAKADAEKLPGVLKELEALKKEDYKGKYEELFSAVEKGKARAAKEAAVRAWYEGKNIRGAGLAIAMRGTPLDDIELGEDGAISTNWWRATSSPWSGRRSRGAPSPPGAASRRTAPRRSRRPVP